MPVTAASSPRVRRSRTCGRRSSRCPGRSTAAAATPCTASSSSSTAPRRAPRRSSRNRPLGGQGRGRRTCPPYAQGLIPSVGVEALAVRREFQPVQHAPVLRQYQGQPPGARVPHLYRAVHAARGERLPVGREGKRPFSCSAAVRLESFQRLPQRSDSGGVPDHNLVDAVNQRQETAVRREPPRSRSALLRRRPRASGSCGPLGAS